jgi:hypothetical protein
MRGSAFLFEFVAAIRALVKLPRGLLIMGRGFLAVRAHLHYFFDGIENDLCPEWVHTAIIHPYGNCRKATWGLAGEFGGFGRHNYLHEVRGSCLAMSF